MKTLTLAAFFFLLFPLFAQSATLMVERGNDLQSVIDYAHSGDTIIVGTKEFAARPADFTDSLCGNCLDPQTLVSASYGFLIKGKSLVIIGQDRQQSVLVTNSGYGLFIVDCPAIEIRNLTVTGGKRDPDGNATDAAIVVRNSKVRLSELDIINNDNRIDSVVVGVGGVFGREGAVINLSNSLIRNGGWDGIALYRGAMATICDCTIGDGRGAGIGVTWDATAVAYRNDISGFWKGIGAFGTSWLIARNNLVHDNLGWGMIATGASFMDMSNNVVNHNGNCGIAPWSTESRGRIVNNIITENGWRNQWVCPCVGVWNYGDWAKWNFSYNIVWNNKDGEYQDIWDQTGLNGNLSVDPLFTDDGTFHLQQDSPGRHTGDSSVFNLDGSISHIGLEGGPQAAR